MRRLFISLIFVFAALGSWGQSKEQDVTQDGREYEGILYKYARTGDSLLIDIYLPKMEGEAEVFPVLLTLHGGAWVKGERDLNKYYFTRELRKKALKNGFAVLALEYSLVNDSVHFPDPIRDVKDGIRWIRAHAKAYHFDTSNIGLWGASAGAQLALLAGYTGDEDWLGVEPLRPFSSKVNYVVDVFGPTKMQNVLRIKGGFIGDFLIKTFLNKRYRQREELTRYLTAYSLKKDRKRIREILRNISPLERVHKDAVPTLIFHGTKDRLVPKKQSKRLNKALSKNGVEHHLNWVKRGNHGFFNVSEERLDHMVEETLTFMKTHSVE